MKQKPLRIEKQPFLDLDVVCPGCVQLDKPNGNCEKCGGIGFVLTGLGETLKTFIQRHIFCAQNNVSFKPLQRDLHDWQYKAKHGWEYCLNCGIVKKKDGQNKPCPGKMPDIKQREEKDDL